jgi:aryl-alcohol dehydrogenase-like predicted oxidoreductase
MHVPNLQGKDAVSISRRNFNKAAIGASALFALGPRHLIAADETLLSRSIPSTGETIPIVGVGTNRYGVGADDELRAPLRAALQTFHDLGGTVIDTAPGYRSSEVVLGELMSDLNINNDLFVATKVDVEGAEACAERMQGSLARLNSTSMDLMQVHNFIGWEEALPVMQEWKKDGRIRYIGITTSRKRQYELMEKVMTQFDLDFIQVNYSLANQRESAERIIPLAADRGMAVIVNRPFGGGAAFRMLSKASIPEWAGDFGVSSWGQFLLKYVLSHPAVTCAIPGMTKQHHVVDNLVAARSPLPTNRQRGQMEKFFKQL